MRTFKQNKLWRDKAVDLTENAGSKIDWQMLDDVEYEKQLRLKIVEEADEVLNANSREELINELGDVMDVIQALCKVTNITMEQIVLAQSKKNAERGGFEGRKFVIKAMHPEGSFAEEYCLNDPVKYPEICEK